MKFSLVVIILFPVCCHGFWNQYNDAFDVHAVAARERRAAENELATSDGENAEKPGHGSSNGHHNDSHGNHTHEHKHHGIHVASWNYDYVKVPFLFCSFWIVVSICKLGFHHAHFLASVLPESCMLVILGTVAGGVFYALGGNSMFLNLTPTRFFLYILPPIILDSAHSLRDRTFLDNLGTILIYAVIGTILNCFIVGPLLFAFCEANIMSGLSLTLVECLVFSSLISAVDPVAVLAIFQEIGVNDVLYFLVFGESLLNDAVTVVIYNMMKTFYYMPTIPASEIGMGIAAFFTVSLGGLSIGLVFGVLTAIFTKYTKQVRIAEPMAVVLLGYMSYLAAEMFHFSGIISMIGCGLIQAQYAFHNIGYKSEISIKYLTKMLSGYSDSIIFLCLGYRLVLDVQHVENWNGWFIFWAIILCLGVRFFVVYLLTFIANKTYRGRQINLEEQFILSYGGLRGAVAFALVNMLDGDTFRHKNVFETTTLAVVVVTIFVQGMSVKPLVKLLRIATADKTKMGLMEQIQESVTDHMNAGVEEIVGQKGRNWFREMVNYYDDKCMKKWLLRDPKSKDDIILQAYQEMEMSAQYEHLKHEKSAAPQALWHTPSDHRRSSMAGIVLDAHEQAMEDEDDSGRGSDVTRGRACACCRRNQEPGDNLDDMLRRRKSYHQNYDRNLTREDHNDLWRQLNDNFNRKFRTKKSRDKNANRNPDQKDIERSHSSDDIHPVEGTPLLAEPEIHEEPEVSPGSSDNVELRQRNSNLNDESSPKYGSDMAV